ncbi:MAG: DUF2750 domain-containing protein [Gammaproteobacteria bacterium]|nr:DUF2750 domain-containing protein [Gammaproteobacteria bacterium]
MTDNEFFQEILSKGHVWVAMEKNTALLFPNGDDSLSVPLWTEYEKANEFIRNINSSCKPVEVPVEVFKASWISNDNLNIKEIIVSPSGLKNGEISLSINEFINGIWH